MLQVILSILKIIGLIILAILALAILLLLLVLFVPIRYKARITKAGEADGRGCVSWLFHIIHVSIRYADGKLSIVGRIFGIPVYRGRKEGNNKKQGKKKKDKAEKKKRTGKEKSGYTQKTEEHRTEEAVGSRMPDIPVDDGDTVSDFTVSGCKSDNVSENKQDDSAEDNQGKMGLFEKIKIKLKGLINNIVEKVKNIYNKITGLRSLLSEARDLFDDPVNKSGLSFCKQKLFELLRHVMPTKAEGQIVFGTGDPCSTGQILGILGILYGKYGHFLMITPDFNEKRFEGSLYIRGRIRLFTLGWICLKVITNKDVKYLRRAINNLKQHSKDIRAA